MKQSTNKTTEQQLLYNPTTITITAWSVSNSDVIIIIWFQISLEDNRSTVSFCSINGFRCFKKNFEMASKNKKTPAFSIGPKASREVRNALSKSKNRIYQLL